MNISLGAVGLFVSDMEKMIGFYRDAVGLPIEWDGGIFTGVTLPNGVSLNFFPRAEFEKTSTVPLTYPNSANGTFEMFFYVDSYSKVDELYDRLVSRGAVSVAPPGTAPWGQRSAFCADPDGNIIEIVSENDDM
ncbi:MAG: VOC family protein [Defluviitaleaceae bacterium]|nr:VOC family protein [Defluviitaleaceae bacterium]